jgi:beta-N-acetylglucosaminidase
MTPHLPLLGVIEGFYGRPWSTAQRENLYARMAAWGMNTYLYAPKDDLRHRARWRDLYSSADLGTLRGLLRAAQAQGLRFVYALAPGLDLNWGDPADREALIRKVTSLQETGVNDFALLFDDIPGQQDRAAQAAEQVEAAHLVLRHLGLRRPGQGGSGGTLLFCPTEYCGVLAEPSVQESPYLRALGEGLDPDIGVFWTGPQIVSPEIDVASVREVAQVLKRRPVLWDNLHASDYTSRRLHLGPYGGRPLALRAEVSGILSNPNTPYEVNVPGLASLAEYAVAGDGWTPEASAWRALEAWLPEFCSPSVQPEDLALLADTLYLPHRLGPLAEALLAVARQLAEQPEDAAARSEVEEGHERFRRVLRALEAGPNRDLLYDLHPFLVDGIEELARLLALGGRAAPGRYPYRGGLGDRLLALGWKEDTQ